MALLAGPWAPMNLNDGEKSENGKQIKIPIPEMRSGSFVLPKGMSSSI